jgi:hypothetical protein
VLIALVPQQHCVTAELQQRATASVRIPEQRREAGVDGVDEVLGSYGEILDALLEG